MAQDGVYIKQENLYNVALFIDYENVYKNLLSNYENTIRDGFFEKFRLWCKNNKRRLVKLAVYCNFDRDDLHNSFHQSLLQSYGVESIHTSNQGKNFADLQITIDVLNAMYLNNNIDEFIIMSNDKDMTPLLNNIRYNKRKVSVLTVGDKYNEAICSFSDEQIKYEDILKEKVPSLNIDALEEKIYRNLEFQFGKNEKNAEESLQKKIQHLEFKFFVEMQVHQCYLMEYEVINSINQLTTKGKISFYTYKFKGKNYTGICPSNKIDYLKNIAEIQEEDLQILDFDNLIKESYDKYN